jgi:hypothetical protein
MKKGVIVFFRKSFAAIRLYCEEILALRILIPLYSISLIPLVLYVSCLTILHWVGTNYIFYKRNSISPGGNEELNDLGVENSPKVLVV